MNVPQASAVEIVPFTSVDVEAREQARLIFAETFPKLAENGFADFDKSIDMPGQVGFLAINQEQIAVGMATASINTRNFAGTSEARLGHMGVLPEARRQKVGWQLLHTFEQTAHAAGKRYLTLETSTKGRPLYTRAGYTLTGENNGRGMRKILR